MKIIIAAEIFPPDIGGPATYSKKITEELAKRDWDVKLLCYSNSRQKSNLNFKIYSVIRNRIKAWHHIKYFFKLFFLSLDRDVIYAQGPISSGLPAMAVGKVLRKKVVVKVVGDYAWEQARNLKVTELGIDEFQNKKFGGKIGRLQKIERKVCRLVDKIIVPSQYLKKIVSGWGVDDKKISVIYNAFEYSKVEVNKNKNQFNIISIGRLVPWKGFEILIQVVAELIRDYPINLNICGDGPELDKLRNLIIESGLSNWVIINSLPRQQLLKILNTADIFVLNTGYEGLSHTILEAMAAGVAVVTTDIGGNPELIQDGQNGLLVEYNNKEMIKEAILKLYNQPELRQKFIDNSKKELNKFTFETMIENTISTLSSIK